MRVFVHVRACASASGRGASLRERPGSIRKSVCVSDALGLRRRHTAHSAHYILTHRRRIICYKSSFINSDFNLLQILMSNTFCVRAYYIMSVILSSGHFFNVFLSFFYQYYHFLPFY